MNYKDEPKRLEEYPQPKELPEDFKEESPKAAVAAGAGAAAVAAAAKAKAQHRNAARSKRRLRASRSGDAVWGIAAAVGVLALVVVVYLLSGVRTSSTETIAESPVVAAYYDDASIEATPGYDNEYMAYEDGTDGTTSAATTEVTDAVYLFPLNGAAVPEDADLNALAQAAVLTGGDVTITAYTDESGAAAYNQKLSEKRAQSVADYLVAHGVPADHITIKGMGPTHAYATAELDRRAEVHLM